MTVDSVASVDCPPLDPPVIYMKGCARDDLVQNFDNYGCYWVYDITVPGEAQILRAEVRYGSAAYTRCSDGTDIETPKPSNDPEQDGPLQPALIDLRAPWFRRLAGRAPRSGCTFLAGSCRHPGSPFERDLADAVFEAMLGEVRRDADHVILAGDQIYADATADIFDTREPGERYSGRYREAFSSRHMRRLLRSVPVYMAIDDHEIGDNWDGEEPAAPGAKKLAAPTRGQLSTIALQAARHYTGIMNAGSAERRQTLWYSFESGGLQFFVMDTRSGRKLRRREVKPGAAVLLHEDQMKEFEKWLRKHAKDERPKFVVCGTPLGPVRRDQVENPSLWRRADTWFGYPAAVKWLVRTMVECRPRNVIFLAGDYHLSAVAELVFYCDDKPSVEAGQIVASGLFSPMPFANERLEDFNWDQWCAIPVVDGGECIGVKGTLLAQGRSHFLRVEAIPRDDTWRVTAIAVGADGARFARARVP